MPELNLNHFSCELFFITIPGRSVLFYRHNFNIMSKRNSIKFEAEGNNNADVEFMNNDYRANPFIFKLNA